jgi:hypothetical protein
VVAMTSSKWGRSLGLVVAAGVVSLAEEDGTNSLPVSCPAWSVALGA